MIQTLAFISFVFATMSVWVHRKAVLWGTFLSLSVAFAYLGGLIHLDILITVGALLGAHTLLHFEVSKYSHFMAFVLATGISLLLIFHKVPGFTSFEMLGIEWNFDKPFIGIFVLALNVCLIQNSHDMGQMLKYALPLTLLCLIVLFFPAYLYKLIVFNPKVSWTLPVWMVRNLFFTVCAEEGFFRGFLQKELTHYIPWKIGGPISILLTSVVFTLCHTGPAAYLVLVFIASLFYGTIFYASHRIEGSILCHFLVNLTRYVVF